MTPRRHDRTTVDLHPAPGEPAVLTLDARSLDAYRGAVPAGATLFLFDDPHPIDQGPARTVGLALSPEFVAEWRAGGAA